MQTPYRFHRRNHGFAAYISSCFRFKASRSHNRGRLVSGNAKMRSSHSISEMFFSTSMLFPILMRGSDGEDSFELEPGRDKLNRPFESQQRVLTGGAQIARPPRTPPHKPTRGRAPARTVSPTGHWECLRLPRDARRTIGHGQNTSRMPRLRTF